MIPIMTLRRMKKTGGVNQLLMEDQIEGMEDTESSNMVFILSERDREGGK